MRMCAPFKFYKLFEPLLPTALNSGFRPNSTLRLQSILIAKARLVRPPASFLPDQYVPHTLFAMYTVIQQSQSMS